MSKSLYVTVETYNPKGTQIGTKIVDVYVHGTTSWIASHMWWAVHNGCTVEQRPSDPQEVEAYVSGSIKQLANKFKAA